jgi:hypothetical protein
MSVTNSQLETAEKVPLKSRPWREAEHVVSPHVYLRGKGLAGGTQWVKRLKRH